MLLLQKLLLENSKLYSSQSQRNYYFDYSQSFIIRTEKKKIRNRWKVSNYAHFQFSNRAFNEITAQPCVTRHEKLFEVPRARFPFARVRRKCFGFRAFGRAPGIINHPLPCITYIAGTIVRSAAGKKKKKRKGKRRGEEEDERERRTNPSAESRRGTVEERPTWTWNQNLNELRGHAPVLPVYRTPLHSWNVAEAFNGVFIVARSWRDLIWITNDEEQTIVVAFICQNPRTIFGSFARKLAAHEDNGNAILGMEKWSRFDECRLRVSDFSFFSFHGFDKSRDFLYFFWRSLNYACFVKRNNSSLHFTINSQFEKRIDTKYSLPWINQAS